MDRISKAIELDKRSMLYSEILRVQRAVGTDSTRPAMQMMHLDAASKILVATSGRSMHTLQIEKLAEDKAAHGKTVVPDLVDMKWATLDRRCRLTKEGILLFYEYDSLRFPNWRRIVPEMDKCIPILHTPMKTVTSEDVLPLPKNEFDVYAGHLVHLLDHPVNLEYLRIAADKDSRFYVYIKNDKDMPTVVLEDVNSPFMAYIAPMQSTRKETA